MYKYIHACNKNWQRIMPWLKESREGHMGGFGGENVVTKI